MNVDDTVARLDGHMKAIAKLFEAARGSDVSAAAADLQAYMTSHSAEIEADYAALEAERVAHGQLDLKVKQRRLPTYWERIEFRLDQNQALAEDAVAGPIAARMQVISQVVATVDD